MAAAAGPRRADPHERLLDRSCAKGGSLYMLVRGFVAIAVNGVAAFVLEQPLPRGAAGFGVGPGT